MKEWEIGLDGKPQPLWKLVYVIYMIDLNTGALYTFVNSTNGAKLAYEQLEEQIAVMRAVARRACTSGRRSRKAPDEDAVRDEVTSAPSHYRVACTWRW